MKQITNAADKKMFGLIVNYLKTGAPVVPFVTEFCKKYDVKDQDLAAHMRSPEAESTIDRLRRLGLL
jgi:hypothetical protein